MPANLQSPLASNQVVSGAKTTTGNSGTLALGLADAYSFILDVTAKAGTSPTLDVAIQHSPDGGTTWYVIQRFTQMTNTGTRNIVFQPVLGRGEASVENSIGGTTGAIHQNAPFVAGKYRVLWTIAGSSPSFTMAVWAIAQPRVQAGY